jgi:hypothetical protein
MDLGRCDLCRDSDGSRSFEASKDGSVVEIDACDECRRWVERLRRAVRQRCVFCHVDAGGTYELAEVDGSDDASVLCARCARRIVKDAETPLRQPGK